MATAPTTTEITDRYPEFAKAPTTLIQECIDEAVERTNRTSDSLWKRLVMVKTARLLAISPQGRSMKLVNKDGSTIYDKELKQLKRAANIGFRTY